MDYRSYPASRDDISQVARKFRKAIGLDGELWLPVVEILEKAMPVLFPGFDYEYVDQSFLGDDHGRTIPGENKIYIREDVYDGACNNVGRDRSTIIHEIGHFILHRKIDLSFARSINPAQLKPFESTEWQAKVFAGECLIPRHLTKGLSPLEISSLCGVSFDAASVQWSKMNGRRNAYGNGK